MSNAIAESRQVLNDPESYGTTLLTLLWDHYGTELLGWTPETIRREVAEDFDATLSPPLLDRLLAAIWVVTADDFYKRLPCFIQICNVLSGASFEWELFDPADVWECAWGLTEGVLLSPPEADDHEPFAEPIRRYLGFVLAQVGLFNPPDLLRLAIFPKQPDELPASSSLLAKQVQQMLQENMRELVAQVEGLPLSAGQPRGLLASLAAS